MPVTAIPRVSSIPKGETGALYLYGRGLATQDHCAECERLVPIASLDDEVCPSCSTHDETVFAFAAEVA
jgi:hypothetical protein